MLTTAIPTVLAHAAHAVPGASSASHAAHGTPNLLAFLAFVNLPALLIFAALLLRKRDVITAVWAASRTTGLPIGPHPWTAESVGLLDLASGACEAGVVACCLWLARTSPAPARRAMPAAAVS